MPGLSGKGYVKLTPAPIRTLDAGRYFYDDTDVLRGKTYCYRVEAEFAKTTSVGIPYNPVEGLASDEVCIQLKRDVPLLTKVSVSSTNTSTGAIELEWVKPSANDLDTVLFPGPYRIQVQRGEGLNPGTYTDIAGASFTAAQFWLLNALSYTDQNLNTVTSPWSYQLAFYHSGNQLLGTSRPGSSVFLTVTPTDRANILRWSYNVPWENTSFEVYRRNDVTATWDLINTTDQDSMRDVGLENGKLYCYYVRSIGSYNISGLPSPLYNLSQQVCATPFDNQPPCTSMIQVVNTCNDKTFLDQTINSIRWKSLLEECPDIANDLDRVELYYAAQESDALQLIATFTAGQTDYSHKPADFSIAGCYSMKAVDKLGNVSAFGNKICVDNCPQYLLPNTFTPNGDSKNDLFKPRESLFISKVDFKVFNRLGIQVFSTTDPQLNWDGRDEKGNEVAEGTYYYTCTTFENRLGGPVQSEKVLSGYILLVRTSR
jgi:gliding motility-associated-like protein